MAVMSSAGVTSNAGLYTGTPDGAVVLERHRSANADSLRRELEARGLHVFQVNAARGRLRIPVLRRERLSSLDFLVFNQQLATLLRAQPLDCALPRLVDELTRCRVERELVAVLRVNRQTVHLDRDHDILQ